MNKNKIEKHAKKLADNLPKNINRAEKADIYCLLAVELGLTHLLLPEAIPREDVFANLPDKAPELFQKRTNSSEKPAEFIVRVYDAWLGKGLAQHHLLHLDKPLYFALHNWLTKNDMPDWLDLPSKKQLNDKALQELGVSEGDELPYPSYSVGLKDQLRLYNAARNRKPKDQ